MFQEVASGRADLTIAARPDVYEFMDNNPDKLVMIDHTPARLYASTMLLRSDAIHFKNALDVTFHEMHLDGTIEKILSRYVRSEHDHYIKVFPYHKLKPQN